MIGRSIWRRSTRRPLDKAEYQSIVAKRFQAANPDNDSTIDVAELKTTAGRRLLRLLQ
jgi:hypothetical protein